MEQLLESLKSKGWPSFESRMQLAFSLFTGSLAVHHIASRFSRLQRIAGASENQRLEAIKLFAATSDKSNDGASIRDYWKTRDGEHDWLENVDSAEALEWVKENNAAAFDALGNPKESPSYGTILSILENKDKIPHISLIGDLYYNYWTDDVNVRGILRRTSLLSYKSSTPKWEIVLDIDKLCNIENESWVYKGYTIYKPDDKNIPVTRCLMKLSRGGADATVVREFDLITKSFVLPTSTNGCDGNSSKSNSNLQQCGFVIPEAKSFVSWKDENTLLIGTDMHDGLSMTDSGYPRTVREWKRGTLLSESKLIMECQNNDMLISGFVSRHKGHKYQMIQIHQSFYTNTIFIKLPMGSWVQVPKPDHATIDQFADQFIITLRNDWTLEKTNSDTVAAAAHCTNTTITTFKAGSVLAVDVSSFLQEKNNSNFTILFEPTERCSMESMTITNKFIIFELLENVQSKLVYWKHNHTGNSTGTSTGTSTSISTTDKNSNSNVWTLKFEENPASIRGISLRAVDDDSNDYLWVTRHSFTQPSSLALVNAIDGPLGLTKAKILKSLPAMFDASNLIELQYEVKSSDGTSIPYFIVHKKDIVYNSNTPTLLYGYGGFEISMTPGYAAVVGKLWLERGGVYVVANIRGGGEFGPRWHQAALKENRYLAYDDFISVAEDLIIRKITCPKKLGIRGGSNGGLLMGNMYNLRPDLWGAVVCQVPLLDMKRYNRLLAGASWMAEYGNPDIDTDWNFLQKYSAYHNISSNIKESIHPPLLMTTSTRDDRVHPYHARSFIKRLIDINLSRESLREHQILDLSNLTNSNSNKDKNKDKNNYLNSGVNEELYYYENIEGGHGGAADNKQAASMHALVYDFLWKVLQR
jgi:prolyl oligopeptidase